MDIIVHCLVLISRMTANYFPDVGAGPLVELFFQGYEFELQLLCIEM